MPEVLKEPVQGLRRNLDETICKMGSKYVYETSLGPNFITRQFFTMVATMKLQCMLLFFQIQILAGAFVYQNDEHSFPVSQTW